MNYMRLVKAVLTGVVVSALVAFAGGCAGPVSENAPDYTEFESVWQYLKVYSIYQERVPEDPFVFRSPEEILWAIADTLYFDSLSSDPHNHYYTRYAGGPSVVTVPSAAMAGSFAAYNPAEIVSLDTLTDSTVAVRIASFDYGITFNEFSALLPKVSRFPNIIIDLRPNGGGEIDEATKIVDAFLPVDKSYIEARERQYNGDSRTAQTVDWHPWITTETARPELRGKRVTVLMRDSTASASEILIAALKDCAGATLVGIRSYGKGIGQIRLQRRDRRTLQITFLQLRGLSGGKVGDYHHKGIAPDITVPANSSNEQWLLTAVRVHEPSATSIRKLKKQAVPAVSFEPAGYRVVYEHR